MRKGVTLMLLWQKYPTALESGCKLAGQAHPQIKPVLRTIPASQDARSVDARQVHPAGEKLFVDFVGPTLAKELRTLQATGSDRKWLAQLVETQVLVLKGDSLRTTRSSGTAGVTPSVGLIASPNSPACRAEKQLTVQ